MSCSTPTELENNKLDTIKARNENDWVPTPLDQFAASTVVVSGENQALAGSLTVVEGDLVIEKNTDFTLTFTNLTRVEGSIFIRQNSNVNLLFPLLEEVTGDVDIGSGPDEGVSDNLVFETSIEFLFTLLLTVGGSVIIGARGEQFGGNTVVGPNGKLSIAFESLESVGQEFLIGSRGFDSSGNFTILNDASLVITAVNLKKIGGDLFVGKRGRSTDAQSPGNHVVGPSNMFSIALGTAGLFGMSVDGSVLIGAFDDAIGGNFISGSDSSFTMLFGLQRVGKDFIIGACNSSMGNGYFSTEDLSGSEFTVETLGSGYTVGGDVLIGASSKKTCDLRGNQVKDAATFNVVLNALETICGSLKIGSFGANTTIGNRAFNDDASLSIELVALREIKKDLLIGAFDGAINGNTAILGNDNKLTIELFNLTKVGGGCRGVLIGAFGQRDRRTQASTDVSLRGNTAALGNNNELTIRIPSLETLTARRGLSIGGASRNICNSGGDSRIVSVAGNAAGDYDQVGIESDGNTVIIDIGSLKKITGCGGLRIGAFGNGIREGNYAGRNGSTNSLDIDLSSLETICASLSVGAFGSATTRGNAVLGTDRNEIFIRLNALKTVGKGYHILKNFKMLGVDQVWCYDASNVESVGFGPFVRENKNIDFIVRCESVVTADCLLNE